GARWPAAGGGSPPAGTPPAAGAGPHGQSGCPEPSPPPGDALGPLPAPRSTACARGSGPARKRSWACTHSPSGSTPPRRQPRRWPPHAPGRNAGPDSPTPWTTAPGSPPARRSTAHGPTAYARPAQPATPHARTPTAAANVPRAVWAHDLRPPRRTGTSLAASSPALSARRGHGSASGLSSPSAPRHATLPPPSIGRSCDTIAPQPAPPAAL